MACPFDQLRFEFQKCSQQFLRMRDESSPLSRCASTIQIVRPLESIAETQLQLQPGLLRLSAMTSQCFTRRECVITLGSWRHH